MPMNKWTYEMCMLCSPTLRTPGKQVPKLAVQTHRDRRFIHFIVFLSLCYFAFHRHTFRLSITGWCRRHITIVICAIHKLEHIILINLLRYTWCAQLQCWIVSSWFYTRYHRKIWFFFYENLRNKTAFFAVSIRTYT